MMAGKQNIYHDISELPSGVQGHLRDETRRSEEFILAVSAKGGLLRSGPTLILTSERLVQIKSGIVDVTSVSYNFDEVELVSLVRDGDFHSTLRLQIVDESEVKYKIQRSTEIGVFISTLSEHVPSTTPIKVPKGMEPETRPSNGSHSELSVDQDSSGLERAEMYRDRAQAFAEDSAFGRASREYQTALDEYQQALADTTTEQAGHIEDTMETVRERRETVQQKHDTVEEMADILGTAEEHLVDASEAIATDRSVVARTRYRQARSLYDEALEKARTTDIETFNIEVDGCEFTDRSRIKTRLSMVDIGLEATE